MKEKDVKTKIQEGDNYAIPDNAEVTVVDFGYRTDIKNSWRKPTNLGFYKKASKNTTIDMRTGEIIEYQKEEFQDSRSINKKMQKLQQLVDMNFLGEPNELFITLTCNVPVFELKVIKRYKNLFLRKLKYKYNKHEFLWIYKFEQDPIPGTKDMYCWHCHILLKSLNHKNLFIPNEEICKMWGRGFTKTERVYI